MADVGELEKDTHLHETDTATQNDEHDDTLSSSGSESPRTGPPLGVASITRSRSRGHQSRHSDDSNPYEALSRALTPDLETEAEHEAREPISHVRTGTSLGSTASRPPEFEVNFEEDGSDDPKNWPFWYRCWVIAAVSYSTWVIVLYSTSYTASIPGLMIYFHEDSEPVVTLGVTVYLAGLAIGSLVVAPASELYGRRYVYLVCLSVFTLLVIPAASAERLVDIMVVRFLGAMFGSAMVSNSPGTVVDIAHPDYLGLCMSVWSIAPLNGPVTGPVIGGFVYQYLGWRWDNWLVLILAGSSILVMFTVRETYAPQILQAKAARLRKETGDERWWSRYDQKVSKISLIRINLSRPLIISLTEPIMWFFNIWISIIYGILYLCFVAYPIVFSEHRGWSPGLSGLAFVGIGIGTMLAIVCEPLLRRLINSHPKDPETGRVPPEASASVMAIGAVLTPIGQLVFSWTCLPTTIHWAVPIAFGIPFGFGNTLSFIYGSNYLAGSYGNFAASALAGNAVMRSFFGGTLPLAGPAMYARLTPQWAGTLLGLMEVLLIPIPFVFYRYGGKIRAKSRIISAMREETLKNERRRERNLRRTQRQKEREETAASGCGVDGAAAGNEMGQKLERVVVEEQQSRRDGENLNLDGDVEKEAGIVISAPPHVGEKDETTAV